MLGRLDGLRNCTIRKAKEKNNKTNLQREFEWIAPHVTTNYSLHENTSRYLWLLPAQQGTLKRIESRQAKAIQIVEEIDLAVKDLSD